MHIHNQQRVRNTLIVLTAFVGGIVTTVLASIVYAAGSQSLADSLLSKIEDKVTNFSTIEKLAYFNAIHADMPAMIAALTAVDAKLVEKINTIKNINDASSSTLGDLVDSTGTSNTNNNPGTSNPTNPATSGNDTSTAGTNHEATVPNNGKDSLSVIIDFPGDIYCGDPSSSSITEDSSVTVGIYKLRGVGNFQDGNGRIRSNPNLNRSQCTKTNGQKKVWIECNGQKKLITDFDNLKNWDVLSCSANTVSQYVAGPTQTNTNSNSNTNSNTNTSTNTNSDIPDAPFITSSKEVTLNAKEIYNLQWNQVPGMEYYIAFDGGMSVPPSIIGSSFRIPVSPRFAAGGSHTVEIKACKTGAPTGAAKCSSRSIVHLTITSGGVNVNQNSTSMIVKCSNGSAFNFETTKGNTTNHCIGVMPDGIGGETKNVIARFGSGNANVTCTPTGWKVTGSQCIRDKNATIVNQDATNSTLGTTIQAGTNTSGTNTAGNITYKNCVSQYMKVAFPSVNLIYKNGGIRMGIASGTEFALPSGKHGESIVVKSQLNENGENLPEFVELHANYVCTDGEWKSQSEWKAISTDTRTIAQICSQNPDLQDCKCTIKPDPVTHIATFYWGSVGGVYKCQKRFTADQFGYDGVRLGETRGIYDDTGKSGAILGCKLENDVPRLSLLIDDPRTVCN